MLFAKIAKTVDSFTDEPRNEEFDAAMDKLERRSKETFSKSVKKTLSEPEASKVEKEIGQLNAFFDTFSDVVYPD